jgi:hypothetical protein
MFNIKKVMTNEELLKEARRRYPKGTVYIPAHMPGSGEKCIAGDPDDFYIYNDDDIIESHGNKEKNGHIYSEYIYDNGRWAEIVELVDKPEIGRYITITDTASSKKVYVTKVMGYYGEKWLNDSPVLLLTETNYYRENKTLYTDDNRTWRYSTEAESDHLDACIAAEEYVDPPVKEVPLQVKYAAELAEVEKLFPEGTEGTYTCPYDGRTETCKRNGPLVLNEYEGFIRIYAQSGLLWSNKHGYSTPNTPPKLKVGQWVKIIDKPEGGRPDHWNPDGEMDKYFGQWVEVVSVNAQQGYDFAIENGWVLNHSDYTEVRDNIIKVDTAKTWLDEQQEHHRRQQAQHDILMNERESFIQSALYTQPLTPEECYKSCESKEDIVSSHLILLDVKPVRVSKQFK